MRQIYFSVGVNPRGTTMVMKCVDPKRSNAFAPEYFLSELDRNGMEASSRTFGEALLRLLTIYHGEAFTPYTTLVTMPAANDPYDQRCKVETIAPFDYNGAMRPQRLGVGVADDAGAVLVVPFVGETPNGPAEALPFAQLNRLGVDAAAKLVGQVVLRSLARFHRDAFGPFASLTGLPPVFAERGIKDIHIAVGLNPAGTTLVVKAIDAARPHAFGPQKFLSEMDRLGFDVSSRWIGEIALRMLALNHAATFAPFARLAAPSHDPQAVSPFEGKVVALSRFTCDGVMQPLHLQIGVADSGEALMTRTVAASGESDAPEFSLARLDALGFSTSASLLGQAALLALARHFTEQFRAYPNLIAPPATGYSA